MPSGAYMFVHLTHSVRIGKISIYICPYVAGSFTIAHSVARAVVGSDWRNERVSGSRLFYSSVIHKESMDCGLRLFG